MKINNIEDFLKEKINENSKVASLGKVNKELTEFLENNGCNLAYNENIKANITKEKINEIILNIGDDFDVIVFNYIVDEVIEEDYIIQKLKNKLKRTGKLFISFTNLDHNINIMRLLDDNVESVSYNRRNNRMVKYNTLKNIEKRIYNMGLSIVDFGYIYNIPFNIDNEHPYLRYTKQQRESFLFRPNSHVTDFILEASNLEVPELEVLDLEVPELEVSDLEVPELEVSDEAEKVENIEQTNELYDEIHFEDGTFYSVEFVDGKCEFEFKLEEDNFVFLPTIRRKNIEVEIFNKDKLIKSISYKKDDLHYEKIFTEKGNIKINIKQI